MKRHFANRLEAIDWIAKHAENEGHFEVMREQLNYNFIYNGRFFVKNINKQLEVMLFKHSDKNL